MLIALCIADVCIFFLFRFLLWNHISFNDVIRISRIYIVCFLCIEYKRTKAKCLCVYVRAFTAFFSKYLFVYCILFLYYNGKWKLRRFIYYFFSSFSDHMKRPRWRQTILFSLLLQLIIVIISINPIPTWHLAFFYFYPHFSSYFVVVFF